MKIIFLSGLPYHPRPSLQHAVSRTKLVLLVILFFVQVALGMVGTGDDQPPPTEYYHCVPRKWCKPVTSPAKLIWDDIGTGGRHGSIWQVGSFGLMQVSHGQSPPTDDLLELASHRFMLSDDSSNIWLPPGVLGNASEGNEQKGQ